MIAGITLEALLEDANRIPAAPGVAMELAQLCRHPDSSIEELVAVLKCDPALTAKMLRVANSAYFAPRREIADLAEAVVRLGLRRVQIMALAFCIMDATSGKGRRVKEFDYNYYWSHSLVTATVADLIAIRLRLKMAAEAMVTGLLQDLGVMVLQTAVPQAYETVLRHQEKTGEELHVSESRRLGFNHMQMGEAVLRRWHLPEGVSLAVGHHHQPETLTGASEEVGELTRVCRFGASVAKHLTRQPARASAISELTVLAGQEFGLTVEETKAFLGEVRSWLNASARMFEVTLDPTVLKRLDAMIRDQIADGVMQFPGVEE